MPTEGEKLNRIEEMKRRLFSKSYETQIEHRNIFSHLDKRVVPSSWKKENEDLNRGEKFFMKTSVFKKFFIFSIVFFVLALLYAGYTFFAGSNNVSNDNINLSIIGNTFTAGGEELPIQIQITNKNSSSLDLVDLVMEYPKSSSEATSGDVEHFRQSLGTIPAGAIRNENLKVTLFGEQGSTRQIKISLEYRVGGSNAIFVKEKIFDVSISSTPINLSVDAPSEISPNQEVTLNVKVALNSTKPVSQMLLNLDYPPGFQFEQATPAPTFGNNVWSLGDINPGVERNITIVGKMVDVFNGEEKTFHISTGSQSASNKYLIGVIFNSVDQTMTIKKPFIDAQLFINGVYQREYAIDTKTKIQGEIRWTNNLDTKINNLEIRAKISGNAFNRKSISVNQGTYNSIDDTMIWDQSSQGKFVEVNPGDSGSVNFSMSPLSLFSGLGDIISLPSIVIEVSISGRQAISGGALATINNGEVKTIKIISDVGFANKILYFSGPFKNTGPIPPKVAKPTTYTVVWTLSNTANSISKTQIISSLPSGVNFVGLISPTVEDLTYNTSTKGITWNVGGLPRGAGTAGFGREVSFQIVFTPSITDVGLSPVLINDAILTGHDDFANVDIRVSKPSLNIRLMSDPLFPSSGDRVVE